jgi:hypothetical protein
VPLRPHVQARRHGVRRWRHRAAGRRSFPHDHHHGNAAACWAGSRNGCRPSGRSSRCMHLRHGAVGDRRAGRAAVATHPARACAGDWISPMRRSLS